MEKNLETVAQLMADLKAKAKAATSKEVSEDLYTAVRHLTEIQALLQRSSEETK